MRSFALLPIAFALCAATAFASSGAGDLLFTRHDGLSGAGQVVVRWLERARLHGLELAPDPIIGAWAAREDVVAGAGPRAEQRAVERALADGLERLVAELPPQPRLAIVLEDPASGTYLSPDVAWRDVPARAAAAAALAAAREAAHEGTLEAHLRSLEPKHPQYRALVEAAERYATLCAAGGWDVVAAPRVGNKGKPAAEVARAFQVRLEREGFYRGEPSGVWDAATEAALTAYREARHLKRRGPDAPDLIAALNVPCEERLTTIELNVRRWRHSAWNGEPTRVEVNLAGQEMRYLRDDALVMRQRTVVGKNYGYFDQRLGRKVFPTSSPILHDHISRIVVNPTWAVPARIAKKEIDAKVAADPTYLEKNRMQIVTSERGRTYIQSPGPDNALGVIKILFPNSESVYLHDTPKKVAFQLPVRALSHGCVRVQNALDFGLELLAADAAAAGRELDTDKLRRLAGLTGPLIHNLTTPVPVFLEYYTASVDDDVVVRFHPDIYEYDVESLGAVVGAR